MIERNVSISAEHNSGERSMKASGRTSHLRQALGAIDLLSGSKYSFASVRKCYYSSAIRKRHHLRAIGKVSNRSSPKSSEASSTRSRQIGHSNVGYVWHVLQIRILFGYVRSRYGDFRRVYSILSRLLVVLRSLLIFLRRFVSRRGVIGNNDLLYIV